MLRIEHVPVSQLKSQEINPRSWSDKAKRDLEQSIKEHGLVEPLLANKASGRENILLSGHFRLWAAQKLGIKEVPVVFLNIEDWAKERALVLRMNKVSGDWDWELLQSFGLTELLDVGFDEDDLSAIWNSHLSVEDDGFDVEQEKAKIKTPRSQMGDLIVMGEHRLIVGDATDPKVIDRVCEGVKVTAIYQDPPYNIRLDYNRGIGTSGKYGGRKTNDHKSEAGYRDFLRQVLQNCLKHTTPDHHVFTWCDETYVGLIQSLYQELGITPRRTCLWIKNSQNVTPQVAFNKAYEPCVYGTRGNPYLSSAHTKFTEILNKEIDNGNRRLEDVLDLLNIWLVKRDPTAEYWHPTQKPVTLAERPLLRTTRVGEAVLDPFSGSGSTLAACEQLKRRALLVEYEPIFADLAVKRFEALAGKEARYER